MKEQAHMPKAPTLFDNATKNELQNSYPINNIIIIKTWLLIMKLVKKQIYTVVSLKHKKYIILNKEKIKKKPI